MIDPPVGCIDLTAEMYREVKSSGLFMVTVKPCAGTSQFSEADGSTMALRVGVNEANDKVNTPLEMIVDLTVNVSP